MYTHENIRLGAKPVEACLRTRMTPPLTCYPRWKMPPYTHETSV